MWLSMALSMAINQTEMILSEYTNGDTKYMDALKRVLDLWAKYATGNSYVLEKVSARSPDHRMSLVGYKSLFFGVHQVAHSASGCFLRQFQLVEIAAEGAAVLKKLLKFRTLWVPLQVIDH